MLGQFETEQRFVLRLARAGKNWKPRDKCARPVASDVFVFGLQNRSPIEGKGRGKMCQFKTSPVIGLTPAPS